MREIKFRFWDTKENKWMVDGRNETNIYDFAFKPGMNWNFITKAEAIERVIVEQFTGLTDKNGTDLDWWEGDIFEHPSGLCVIKWYEGGLYMHGSGGFIQVGHAAGWAVLPVKIGNIHQHPKLLPDSRNICLECGADICSICGACLTEHNEDPVNNCPEQSIHRTTKLTQREQNNG